MNIFILNTMNHENLTIKQREDNSNAAYTATDTTNDADGAAAYAADDNADSKYWLNEYFMATGESRPDYEAELELDNSFREVS